MYRFTGFAVVMAGLLALSATGAAANKKSFEAAKRALVATVEGQEVIPLKKLPATKEGAQLYFNVAEKGKHLDRQTGLDLDDYDKRLEGKGIGLEPGEVATVTRMVIGNNVIELHMDGGGLGRRGSGHVNKQAPSRDRQGGSRINLRYGRKITESDLQLQNFLQFAGRLLDLKAVKFELAKKQLAPDMQKALAAGKIVVGMTSDVAAKILPKPLKIELPDVKANPDAPYVEVRHYEMDGMPLVVWFENGRVTKVRDYRSAGTDTQPNAKR